MNKLPNSLWLTLVVLSSNLLPAQTVNQTPARKAAIFVENRVGPALNDKVAVLEDFLTSRVTEKGFSVISREVATDALKTYTSVEVAVASAKAVRVEVETPKGQAEAAGAVATASAAQAAATPSTTKLDQLLSDNTSALRLAQNLGADYLLVASIASFGNEKKTFEDGGLKTVNMIYTLRVSYKVLEAVQGGSLVGDTIKVSKTTRYTENSQTENSDLLNELLDQAASQVADSAGKKQTSIAAAAKPGMVDVIVSCGMQDLVQMPVSVPDIRTLDNGTLLVSTNRLGIQVLDVTVEVNGIAVGSAPGKFKVPPGLNKIRITREGFNPWERTVNFSDGQKFNVALQMSESGYARWQNTTTFLFALKTGEKMTDGVREMMGGFAQTLRQSGYRVDSHTDVKANIETKGKSLFDGATLKIFGD